VVDDPHNSASADRDGTSQSDRHSPALDPAYAPIDERSIEDLLRFVKRYGHELRFFNQRNQPDGDWADWLGDDVAALRSSLEDPDLPDAVMPQPHVALLLTFLELLQHARSRMNEITRRHLEFVYHDVLGLTERASVPDQTHVLVELARGQEYYRLPAGTLLRAGKDSRGGDLLYRTDHDLDVNRARVAELKSLFAQKRLIGLAEARRDPSRVFPRASKRWGHLSLSDQAFMAMLTLALADLDQGESLPAYSHSGNRPALTLPPLADLDQLAAFVHDQLQMPLPAFRTLMEQRRQQQHADATWTQINALLQKAGARRQPGFELHPKEPRNFEANLLQALGLSDFKTFFDSLPAVTDIYGLYRLREREDVQSFIPAHLHLSLADFTTMMQLVEEIYQRWRRIYAILRAAARRKDRTQTFNSPGLRAYHANLFDLLVQRTLGSLQFPQTRQLDLSSLETCYQAIGDIEAYFHMPAETYYRIRAIAITGSQASDWEWDRVDAALEQAHTQVTLARKQAALDQARKAGGFDALIKLALGDPLPDGRTFADLDSATDADYIRERLYLELSNFAIVQRARSFQPNDPQWVTVYKILALAEQRRNAGSAGRIGIEQWQGLYAAADATQVQVQNQGAQVTPRWHTFGAGLRSNGRPADGMAPAAIGFALASPLLALAEGERSVSLTLTFDPIHFDRTAVQAALVHNPFRCLLSNGKAMIEAESTPNVVQGKSHTPAPLTVDPIELTRASAKVPALTFRFKLSPQAPPIEPAGPGAGIASPWPHLELRLRDDPAANDLILRGLLPLRLVAVDLQVTVAEIAGLSLQNDDGELNPRKPFEPFGFAPLVGSNLAFGHPELCAKRLDHLTLTIDWMGAPASFKTYYQGYRDFDPPRAQDPPPSPIAGNADFKALLRLHDQRAGFTIAQCQLFDSGDAAKQHTITINRATISAAYSGYDQLPQLAGAPDLLDWSRFWQLELLAPDFLHEVYPQAAVGYAGRRQNDHAAPFIIKQPYTPRIKRLTAGYSASARFEIAASRAAETSASTPIGALYQIEPFGYRCLDPAAGEPATLLPQFPNEGELYIGIADLQPPQSLTLLVQLADGSADPRLAHVAVAWSYLDGDRWVSLDDGRLVADRTAGLLNSGVLTFNVPAAVPSTRLPDGLYWLRAAVVRHSPGIADMVAIAAQAVGVTYVDQGTAPEHYDRPLAPYSISGPVRPLPALQAIYQPFSSTGGKGPEDPARFAVRVSERLRHKHRALTSWDYERMVLEAFPEIYKVKCLPVGSTTDPRLSDQVRVIVVPDIRGSLPFDPFEPRVAAGLLQRIEQYLAEHTPASARFSVDNPTYIRLRIRLSVRLRPDYNPARHYPQQIDEELQRYLAPWAYDRSAEIVLGGRINASLIIDFAEQLPYVDYVAGIELKLLQAGAAPQTVQPDQSIPPDAILVSDRKHVIDLISEETYREQFFSGINYMQIEFDFQIA
jgi:hypothetical protein